jgi:predicted nuclease of restriction endonuclease-like (RecB) superfamily
MSQLTTTSFTEIVHLIAAAKQRAIQAVNTSLIDLYWQVGEIISRKIASAEWGDGVVNQLAEHIAQTQPGLRGFTRRNLFRMRQFYETYQGDHSESDLHQGLLAKLKTFLGELGRDFCFVGSQFPVQVGARDFALDLLFFHRSLNCLVAIEPHENPAIGVLLCASKDDEVVEYALSRTASPALIAQYETQLPDKALLQRKLHEFYLQNTGVYGDHA